MLWQGQGRALPGELLAWGGPCIAHASPPLRAFFLVPTLRPSLAHCFPPPHQLPPATLFLLPVQVRRPRARGVARTAACVRSMRMHRLRQYEDALPQMMVSRKTVYAAQARHRHNELHEHGANALSVAQWRANAMLDGPRGCGKRRPRKPQNRIVLLLTYTPSTRTRRRIFQ